ncbi:hypothetical protein ACFSVM_03675 [Paenibacillus shunpengii]|uniref:Uncharacterized protein n=1 Tax=Paenibacillus shunpengii TaxID=2054424 RepID=A0ABW5SJI9_9BACL
MKIVKPVIIEDYNDDWPFIFNELKEIHYIIERPSSDYRSLVRPILEVELMRDFTLYKILPGANCRRFQYGYS